MFAELLRDAILSRHAMTTVYRNYVRFFCPYSLGSDQAGRAVVVVFQYEGGKPGGLPQAGEWQVWNVAELHDLRQLDEPGGRYGRIEDAPVLHSVTVSVDA